MSDEKIDAGEIEQAKSSLSHVETARADPSTKLVFKCDDGQVMDIPADLLEKMENDEDISALIPKCADGTPMKISVVEK